MTTRAEAIAALDEQITVVTTKIKRLVKSSRCVTNTFAMKLLDPTITDPTGAPRPFERQI